MKRRIIKKVAKDIEDSIDEVSKTKKAVTLISSGSTVLNLECSGTHDGAFQTGKMVNVIGDSSSGKTLLCLTCFSECCLDAKFDEYDLIFDDVEASNEFDVAKLFGKKAANRIDFSQRSKTIEDFNDNIARRLDNKTPFIYILDSFDALTSEAFSDKDADNRKKREKGNEVKGSYGDGKAKVFSDFCKNRIQDLKDTESILIIISQTRDNIGFGAQFTPKVRSGGKALRFYACHEIWLDCTKTIKKGKRTIRTNVRAKVTKNKLTGERGEATFPVLRNYGIDDVASCVDFMIDEGVWKGPKTGINTKEFVEDDMRFSETKLIEYIEEKGLQQKLRKLCRKTYRLALKKLNPKRKPKY